MKTKIFYDFEATGVSRDADPISLGIVAVTEVPLFSTRIGMTDDSYYSEIKTFYAEFTDFNLDKCDNWVKENIVSKLILKDIDYNNLDKHISKKPFEDLLNNNHFEMKGSKESISFMLKKWLSQFEEPCFIADFDVIDKPMLIDLIADWNTVEQNTTHIDINAIPSGISLEDFISNWKKYQTISTAITPPIQTEKVKTGLPKHLPNIRYDQFFDLHTILWLKDVDTDINREEFVKKELIELIETQDLQNPIVSFKIAGERHNALWDAFVNWKCFEKLNEM